MRAKMYFTKPAHALAHAHVTVRLRTVAPGTR